MIPVYFAQKAFIISDGKLLAVRRDPTDENEPCKWEVPGGRLEEDENLDEHLIREVLEETSIVVKAGKPFYVWKWKIKRKGPNVPDTIVAVARLCSVQAGELGAHRRVADDHLDLMEWLPLDQLQNYEWIPNMLPVIEELHKQLTPVCSSGESKS